MTLGPGIWSNGAGVQESVRPTSMGTRGPWAQVIIASAKSKVGQIKLGFRIANAYIDVTWGRLTSSEL